MKAKEEEMQKIKKDMDDLIQTHQKQVRVLMGVIHRAGMVTITEHIQNKLPNQKTRWLKKQRADLVPRVVRFFTSSLMCLELTSP